MPAPHHSSLLERLRARLNPLAEPRDGQAPPFALLPGESTPLLGLLRRFRHITSDPTDLALRAWERYLRPFTLRIPGFFDLTYLDGREGYHFVMDLDPEVGRMGPVMSRVPTVGFWFPRSDRREPHLQRLILAARELMASELAGRARLADGARIAAETARAHAERWSSREAERDVDLAAAMVEAIYDAFGRVFAGDALWGRIAHEAMPLYRVIADGINIPRTTLATVPPASLFVRERVATRRLERLLAAVIAEHDASGRYPLIDRIRAISLPADGSSQATPLPEGDVAWMLMYVLWNALTYPGSYGFWAFADIIARTDTLTAVESGALSLEDALLETMRLHPVSSLVRETTEEVSYRSADGQTYRIPPGGYVGTFPYQLNRDPATHQTPDVYDPARYHRGEPTPLVFGRGPFGCVAANLVLGALPAMFRVWLEGWSFELRKPLPDRITRVHLTYPEVPVRARVRRRAAAHPIASVTTNGCPMKAHGAA